MQADTYLRFGNQKLLTDVLQATDFPPSNTVTRCSFAAFSYHRHNFYNCDEINRVCHELQRDLWKDKEIMGYSESINSFSINVIINMPTLCAPNTLHPRPSPPPSNKCASKKCKSTTTVEFGGLFYTLRGGAAALQEGAEVASATILCLWITLWWSSAGIISEPAWC